jgi:hypothetical protein
VKRRHDALTKVAGGSVRPVVALATGGLQKRTVALESHPITPRVSGMPRWRRQPRQDVGA